MSQNKSNNNERLYNEYIGACFNLQQVIANQDSYSDSEIEIALKDYYSKLNSIGDMVDMQ